MVMSSYAIQNSYGEAMWKTINSTIKKAVKLFRHLIGFISYTFTLKSKSLDQDFLRDVFLVLKNSLFAGKLSFLTFSLKF